MNFRYYHLFSFSDVVANIPPLDVVSVEKPSDRTAFKSDIPDVSVMN